MILNLHKIQFKNQMTIEILKFLVLGWLQFTNQIWSYLLYATSLMRKWNLIYFSSIGQLFNHILPFWLFSWVNVYSFKGMMTIPTNISYWKWPAITIMMISESQGEWWTVMHVTNSSFWIELPSDKETLSKERRNIWWGPRTWLKK